MPRGQPSISRSQSGLPEASPVIPNSAGPGPRSVEARRVRPGRRAARARGWRWREACLPPPASPDRHDSRLPEDLEAVLPSHLGCGSDSLPSRPFPPPWRLAPSLQPAQFRDTQVGHPWPFPSPTPPGGVQEPPQGRTRWLRGAGMPPGRANRYGGMVGHLPARPLRGEGPETAAGFAHRGEERGGNAGEGEGRRRGEGANGWWHSPLAGPGPAARAHSPEARVPRRGGAELGGSLRGPQGGGGADAGAGGQLSPHTHTPSQRPRPRAGILAAAGSHGAPGRSPSARRASASPPSAWSTIWARASLSLSSAPVWGSRAPHPARRAPLPLPLPLAVQSPSARAQPMCAAASQRPGAQWPRPRRSCAP